MSDWYQARPKFVKPGAGVPSDAWLLFCTVNRSKPRFGLNPESASFIVSFCAPRVTVALAEIGTLPLWRAHLMNALFGNSVNVFDDGALAPRAAETPMSAAPASAIATGTASNRLRMSSPFRTGAARAAPRAPMVSLRRAGP